MKLLIIYDSVFGNTEKIAKAIASSLETKGDVNLCHVNHAKTEMLNGIDVLIIGSPTRGFRATVPISNFLNDIAPKSLKGLRFAAFDTRIDLKTIKFFAFRYLVNKGGYAANVISEKLIKLGGTPIVKPEGFLVTGEEGPLKTGELERANLWLSGIE